MQSDNLLKLLQQAGTLNRVLDDARQMRNNSQKILEEHLAIYNNVMNEIDTEISNILHQYLVPTATDVIPAVPTAAGATDKPFPVLAHFDDGIRYEFWGFSGGAHQLGLFGEIVVAKRLADDSVAEVLFYQLVRTGTDTITHKP